MRILTLLIIFNSFTSLAQTEPYKYSDSLPAYPEEQELEYRIKYYLSEKYTPGSCYGMPSPRKYDLDKIANYDLSATSYIKSRTELKADSPKNNRKIALRILQFNKIKLTKTKTGFEFQFTDGNCCRISTVKGSIKIDHGSILDTITSKEVKHVPC